MDFFNQIIIHINNFLSLNNIAFSLFSNKVSYIELINVIFGLLCVFLAGRNKKSNFWFGYIYNIFLFILFFQKHLYSVMLLQPLSLGLTMYGHWRWTHPNEKEKSIKGDNSLKVTSLNPFLRIYIIGLIGFTTVIWGYILSKLGHEWFSNIFSPDPHPYLDAFILMITIIAIGLSSAKKWECWILWLFVNIFNMILYLKNGLAFLPIISFIYLLNGIWSLFTWYKLYKSERNAK